MANPVEVYSSGVLVSAGTLSEEQELELGGCDSMFVHSGGTAVATVINEGTLLTADSGAEIGYINVEDGGVLSATDAYCSGAARWYGPVACATSGDIILSGGTFCGNTATDLNDAIGFGGAFQVYAGSLSVTGGLYSGNSATGGGGAAYVNGNASIDGAEFIANSALYGGAVEMAHAGSMTIANAVFSGNSAEFGGGFENHQGASTTITDTIFDGNSASSGGAVLNDNYALEKCHLTVNNVTFTGNLAEQGGAIKNDGVLVVSGGAFVANKAEEGKGGALYNVGTATVEGAAFSENTAVHGGAVWQGKKKLTLNGNAFADNTAIYGGALYANTSGSTVISGGEFYHNAALYDEDYELGGMGGALYVAGAATVTVTDTEFYGNYAEVNPASEWDGGCGGAVINYGELTVSGGAFMGNSAYYGGALYNQAPYPAAGESDGTMTVTDTDFTGNVAEWGGGAICNCYGTLTVTGGTYSGNTVTGASSRDGGAIANWSDADITGAIFTANTASKGGALSNTGTTLTVTDAVFTDNTADEGGAFWNFNEWGDSVAAFVNCTFDGNTATQGGAIWNGETLYLSGCDFTTATDSIYNTGTLTVTSATTFNADVVNADGAVFAVSLADFTTETAAAVNGWSFISGGDVELIVNSDMEVGDYRVATGIETWSGEIALIVGGTAAESTFAIDAGAVTAGTISSESYVYTLSLVDDALALSVDFNLTPAEAASSLADNGTTVNGSDKAAKWDETTTYSANVFLADGLTDGNAWLDIDGFADNAANLYGTAKNQNFTGSVNIKAEAGTIRNLAAGAAIGGKVGGVKLTVGNTMNVTGAVYAGGMGDVTGGTETSIRGGELSGNVFAGALCNYVANQTATATGDIALTVDGGTFKSNIYAGAAVKAGAATGIVHTAGDITVALNGGTATKNSFCLYGGGYATGSIKAAAVYAAGDVDITVTGGSWGTYQSGRGIFGGVYADKVAASVDSAAITVTGGKLGNVYGGGWAQNGGKSTVGDVTITIAGDAEVANVFGGGSYSSSSGGETEVGAVTIRVEGGSIAGNIFAGGQNEFSTVTGDVNVTFTGSNGYDCSVYGYGFPAGTTDAVDKFLTFDTYTGTLSGNIGGFDSIKFAGDTAAALSGENIDNAEWCFDYAGRTLDADLAMLTLDGGAFTGDNVSVDFSYVDQAAGGWSIAAGITAADATFGVALSTGSAANLGLNDTLGSAYGVYEGWGFTLEDSTLKFKQLA